MKLRGRRFEHEIRGADDLVGRPVMYMPPDHPNVPLISGICREVIHTGTLIWDTNTNKQWAGVRFKIEVTDYTKGGPAVGEIIETITYPNMERPLS